MSLPEGKHIRNVFEHHIPTGTTWMIYCKVWCHCLLVILPGVLIHRTGSPRSLYLAAEEITRLWIKWGHSWWVSNSVHPQSLPYIFHLQSSCWPLHSVWVNLLTTIFTCTFVTQRLTCFAKYYVYLTPWCPLCWYMDVICLCLRSSIDTAWVLLLGLASCLSILNYLCHTWVNRSVSLHSNATNVTSTDRWYLVTSVF